jgi:GMP synthase-like glutamine amidotransferase
MQSLLRQYNSWTRLLLFSLVFSTALLPFQHYRSSGCFSATGDSETSGPSVRLQPSSEFNQRLLLEEAEWQRRLQVTAELFVIPADNAYAEPGGNVLLGQQLADQYVSKHDAAYAFQALGYIAAHEYGHQFQFRMTSGKIAGGPATELQADAIAGYWIGMRLREQVDQGLSGEEAKAVISIDEKAAFDIGDYLFGSPSHHGTPAQRHAAVRQGIKSGYAHQFGTDFKPTSAARQLFDQTGAIVSQLRN